MRTLDTNYAGSYIVLAHVPHEGADYAWAWETRHADDHAPTLAQALADAVASIKLDRYVANQCEFCGAPGCTWQNHAEARREVAHAERVERECAASDFYGYRGVAR